MSNAALLLAAGQGSRMHGRVDDKILEPIHGKPTLCYSIEAFLASQVIDQLAIIYRDEEQQQAIQKIISSYTSSTFSITTVPGGKERQDSVFAGLSALSPEHDYVFIHDGARPLLQASTVIELLSIVEKDHAATVARPVTDTIKHVTCDNSTYTQCDLKNVDRNQLWAMETPQAFKLETIIKSHKHVIENGLHVTDDTSALATCGFRTSLLHLDYPNPKLTSPDDIPYIAFLLSLVKDNT